MLVQWFNTIDKDRSGTLDAVELQQALRLGKLNFSLFAVAQMVRCLPPLIAVWNCLVVLGHLECHIGSTRQSKQRAYTGLALLRALASDPNSSVCFQAV